LRGEVRKCSLIQEQRFLFALLQEHGVAERRQIGSVVRAPNQCLLEKLCSGLRRIACAGKETQDIRRVSVVRVEC
jgi:hypothetical protein